MANDPIQGLIDYVQEIKPYHTKILDVAVAYAHNEPVDLSISEEPVFEILLDMPSEVDESGVPVRVCPEGWGIYWDRPTPFVVLNYVPGSPLQIPLSGDQTITFQTGITFEVRTPEVAGSPQSVLRYTSTGATYIEDDDVTLVSVASTDDGPLTGSEFFLNVIPPDVTGGDVYIVYPVDEMSAVGSPLGSPLTSNSTIVVDVVDAQEFVYGRAFQIRNATDPAANGTYHVLAIQFLTPTRIEVVTIEPIEVAVGSPFSAEMVFTADGWDGPDYCSDIPLGWTQAHISDRLDMEWDFANGSPQVFADYQFFILSASGQEFVVWGDARGIGPNVEVIHSITPGSPLSTNDGSFAVVSTTYDSVNNTTTVDVGVALTTQNASGWIVSA